MMNQQQLKRNLWYGKGIDAWYNREVEAPITATIETVWGTGQIELKGDYCIEFRLDKPVAIHRIDYDIHCYLTLRLSREDYELSNSSKRLIRIKENGEKVLGAYPTEKAQKQIYETIKPCLIEWVENHGALLLKAHHISLANRIKMARHKLHKIEEEITQRHQYLDILEKELEETGGLQDEDKRRLEDIWGNSWSFK